MTFSKSILTKIIIPIILGVMAIAVIFYKFTDIPPLMNKDEQEFAILALSLGNSPYIPYSPLATGHATLYFYMILASFNIFGLNTFALRLPAALFGVLNVLVFYYLIRYIFGYKHKLHIIIPFLTTCILISSRWYINFARFAFEATLLLFLELISTFAIFKYEETKKIRFLIISGIFAGLAYNSYTPGRLFFILPLCLLLLNISVKALSWNMIKPVLIFLASFMVMILPLTIYLSQNTDTRIYQQFFITNEQETIWTRMQWLWQNIINNFVNMFFFTGDVNGIHNYPYKPALNPLIGLLFIGGLILSIKHIKNKFDLFFISYFILSIIPTIFTYPWENPNMLRTFTALPAIVYFCGKSIIFLLERLKYNLLITSIITLLLIISAGYELRTYFIFQSGVFKDIFINTMDFEYYRKLYK
ncbi:MAG TPA: glycosyltransferase family 39 protein [Candidatus Woesebacteria bacterium]|nr:glycosyltransferase family 39 protein [Candidatus Woesebacteria bacterium]